MFGLMILAVLAQPNGPVSGRTTPIGTLSACAPSNLKDAVSCLESRLSEADRKSLVGARGGANIRGQIDRFIQYEFRLHEADAALGNWLRRRGISSPMAQSAVVIEEYLASLRGGTLDLKAVAKASARIPNGTPPTLAELTAEEAETQASAKIDREECAAITKLPLAEIGECFRVGDRIKVSRVQRADDK